MMKKTGGSKSHFTQTACLNCVSRPAAKRADISMTKYRQKEYEALILDERPIITDVKVSTTINVVVDLKHGAKECLHLKKVRYLNVVIN